jgi:hypothetical protein
LLHFNFTLYRMCVSIYIHTYAKCFFNVRVTTGVDWILSVCERESYLFDNMNNDVHVQEGTAVVMIDE